MQAKPSRSSNAVITHRRTSSSVVSGTESLSRKMADVSSPSVQDAKAKLDALFAPKATETGPLMSSAFAVYLD